MLFAGVTARTKQGIHRCMDIASGDLARLLYLVLLLAAVLYLNGWRPFRKRPRIPRRKKRRDDGDP